MKTIRFNPWFFPLIREGKKTQTRRYAKDVDQCRWGASGDVLAVQGTDMHIRITGVSLEYITDISDEDVRREGFGSRSEFFTALRSIYPGATRYMRAWVISFELVSGV